jgi:hypothetical protein
MFERRRKMAESKYERVAWTIAKAVPTSEAEQFDLCDRIMQALADAEVEGERRGTDEIVALKNELWRTIGAFLAIGWVQDAIREGRLDWLEPQKYERRWRELQGELEAIGRFREAPCQSDS